MTPSCTSATRSSTGVGSSRYKRRRMRDSKAPGPNRDRSKSHVKSKKERAHENSKLALAIRENIYAARANGFAPLAGRFGRPLAGGEPFMDTRLVPDKTSLLRGRRVSTGQVRSFAFRFILAKSAILVQKRRFSAGRNGHSIPSASDQIRWAPLRPTRPSHLSRVPSLNP